jgi:HrpA-like RNA helicase
MLVWGYMGERMNGRAPYARRTQGSGQRGHAPTPSFHETEYRLRQSRQDREKTFALWKPREREAVAEEHLGLGNRELPAFNHKFELVANIEAHKAVIVGGETGSGKSTQLPQYLYEAGYDMTIMLVPRRVIADGLGDRIRAELAGQIEGLDVGETVGIIHGERVERHGNNKIMVMTPNTFIKMEKELRELYGDKKLAIIADEIHEANLFTEIAVGVAALSVRDQENWRLVAASATHNTKTLQAPFSKLNDGYVPSVEIKGRPFNVELREEPALNPMQAYARDSFNYEEGVVAHEKTMIFTSGKKEIQYIIDGTRRELEKLEKGSSNRVIFRVLHGELTETELSHINDPIPEGYRLVVVSSPAGMSGITIPGVTYVATDGTINRSELDDDKASGLMRRQLSKAGITQQIGRAGRDVAGGIGVLCAPVIVKNPKKGAKEKPTKTCDENDEPKGIVFTPFTKRIEHEPPEIYSTNLSRVVLSVSSLGYNFAELNEYIPHPVQEPNIISAEKALKRLGALDANGVVTKMGKGMDRYPVTPELARGLYEAEGHHIAQHMARAAFIAAAIDVGGLQDHQATEEAKKMRRQIIRSTSSDDFIVQLDLMTKLYERTSEGDTGYAFVERHGLHPKRVERVRKTTRKIFAVMGLRTENTIVTAPITDEEQLLRDDFTSGFIDYVYEDVGTAPRSRKVLYRNIHGDESSTKRTISDRSASTIPRQQLVAGIPRWYEKGVRKDGTPIKHDIIDHVLMVHPDIVGRHALANGLVEGVWRDSRIVDGYAVDYEQGMFGSIIVGIPAKRVNTEVVSPQSQEALYEYVLKNQGRVQLALRRLASELEGYRKRTPEGVLAQLRNSDAPQDITQAGITEMLKKAVTKTVSARGVEDELSNYIYRGKITLEKYYDISSVQLLNEMSPLQITIAGEYARVQYDNGQPYVTNLTKRHLSKVKEAIYLEDGREILYQRQKRGGGKERISFSNVSFS